ncbi:MAG: phage/plasmid primase, P4 family, partial [candidate division NC10 bacterium]|nr:phage/plasmid primase, P4 family [candidate division NC10 bacterium]
GYPGIKSDLLPVSADEARLELGAHFKLPPPPGAPIRSHSWNADLFAARYRSEHRYCAALRSWFHYDGRRWRLDPEGLTARDAMRATAARMFEEATKTGDQAMLKWGRDSAMARGVANSLFLAQSILSVDVGDFDADPDVLNVANGLLDLRTGELRPHRAEDMVTRVTAAAYRPGAQCPLWDAFLLEVLPDPEVRAFFRRLMGYALLGRQRAKAFAIVYGEHDGGKTTALGACTVALGWEKPGTAGATSTAYAVGTELKTFASGDGGNRPGLVKLMGARLVVVSEVKEELLESGTLKAWSGGDLIAATAKYAHPVNFLPDGLVVFVGNKRPMIDWEDLAMWERAHEVNFPLTIPEERRVKDYHLRFDPDAVLAWMVAGCLEFLATERLAPPDACRAARLEHREGQDPLREFWAERVEVDPVGAGWVTSEELFAEYRVWAEDFGVAPRDRLTQRGLVLLVNARFGDVIRYTRKGADGGSRSDRRYGWEGLRLTRSEE